VEHARRAPVALLPELANEQHYEVPPALFRSVLGRHLKYSCCYWPAGVDSLDEAEAAALEQTCMRADIGNGMSVLELGCGWGSLTLWLGQHYPDSRITAVSNSRSQQAWILEQARLRGLGNIDVRVSDMNVFDTGECYDRVVSVEMFEHMRNYAELFRRIHGWLKPDGRFFMHIFCHRSTPYEFEDRGPSDWMSRHFFSGGMMPSDDLPLLFQDDLVLERRWRWHGGHYRRTAEAWLARMDNGRAEIWPLLENIYGTGQARKWWMRWRIFFMSCAELFGYDNGQQWWVGHYRFRRRGADS
jgi:cyclopropane-fatty-acyl-phospholipid synthase